MNGQVLTVFGTTYDEVARYSCDTGYQVNGVSNRTCLSNGVWGASEPTCDILGIYSHNLYIPITKKWIFLILLLKQSVFCMKYCFCRRRSELKQKKNVILAL